MALKVGSISGIDTTSTALRVAPPSSLAALVSALESGGAAAPSRNVTVNFATGSAASQAAFATAASFCRGGGAWVDYGAWPFGADASGFLALGLSGFSAFIHAAGLTKLIGAPPSSEFDYDAALAAEVATPFNGYFHVAANYPFGYQDAFDFYLHDWFFGSLFQGNYPYAFGLPTTTDLTRAPYARVMAGAPSSSQTVTVGTRNYRINVYSVFSLRVGSGWYFNAQPSTDPNAYAQFILETLGVKAPALLPRSTGSGLTSLPSSIRIPASAGSSVILPTATLRLTNPYTQSADVQLLQLHLQTLGYGSLLGPTGADGSFGPDTQAAVLAFQRRNAGRTAPDGRKIVANGVVGPANWSLLLAGQPARAAAASTGPPAVTGSSATSKGGGPTATKATVLAKGAWVNGVPNVVVNGQDVPVSKYVALTSAQLATLKASGGVVSPVLGFKIHFTKLPVGGSSPSAGTGMIASLVDSLSKATGLPPTDVEFLGAAGIVAAGLLLFGK